MALHCASPSPTHMTPKPSSAPVRPTAAHFFDQLKYISPSQAPTVPPSAAVSWVSDSWLSSGTKRRAIDNTDDDPVYDEFIRYCAPIAASGKVLHESSPSIDVPTDTPCVPLDGPPGDEHYQSRALSPAQVPRHFRGMPWDDRRVRTLPTAPVQPSMPVHRTDDLPSADHRADGHSDTDSDSISAIQRLYKVSTGRLTSPSVFSESSQAREMARASREPDPTRSGTQPMRADDDDDVSSMRLDVHGMDGSTPARSPATVANRSTDRAAPWLPPTAPRMMPTEAAQASPEVTDQSELPFLPPPPAGWPSFPPPRTTAEAEGDHRFRFVAPALPQSRKAPPPTPTPTELRPARPPSGATATFTPMMTQHHNRRFPVYVPPRPSHNVPTATSSRQPSPTPTLDRTPGREVDSEARNTDSAPPAAQPEHGSLSKHRSQPDPAPQHLPRPISRPVSATDTEATLQALPARSRRPPTSGAAS